MNSDNFYTHSIAISQSMNTGLHHKEQQDYETALAEFIMSIPEPPLPASSFACRKKELDSPFCECTCVECNAGEQLFKEDQIYEHSDAPEAPVLFDYLQFCTADTSEKVLSIRNEQSPYGELKFIQEDSGITSTSNTESTIEHARYKCEHCLKRFSVKKQLVIHMRVHTGERPYPCNVCGKAFSHRCNMKAHKRIHTGEKPFYCEQCDMWFRQRTHMNMHFLTKKHQTSGRNSETSH